MQRVEMDDWPVFMEPSCETLFMCFITTFKEGIRAGGGISDVLRKPASHVRVKTVGIGWEERERVKERGRGREREGEGVREGERERERERERRESQSRHGTAVIFQKK